MDFNEHLEMAKDPNNIPGIYNYCDAWCERCTFTSRCLNFKSRGLFEEEIERRQREEENKAFWDEVNEAIEDVKDLLEEHETDSGNDDAFSFEDFEDEDTDDAIDEYEKHRKRAKEQPVSIAGMRYMDMVRDFFKSKEGTLDRFYTEGEDAHKVTVKGISDELTLRRISVAVQLAFYYHMQIWVKINRALTSSFDDFEHDEEYADFPKDSDGSAKVALLGIDQSIGAWTSLYKYLEDDRDEISKIILLLRQLRAATERTFPDARAFKRPGFDD